MATTSRKRPLDSLTTTRLNTLTSPQPTIHNTTTTTTTVSQPINSNKKPRLTQLTLDLGQKVHTKCKTCGMNYILSSDEDRRLHKKYHDGVVAENEMGIALTKAAGEMGRVVGVCGGRERKGDGAARQLARPMFKSAVGGTRRAETKEDTSIHSSGLASRTPGVTEQSLTTHDQDHILEIRRSDPRPLKTLARRVLEAAESALGAVPIEEKQLWSQAETEGVPSESGGDSTNGTKAGLPRRQRMQEARKRSKKPAAAANTPTRDAKDVRGGVEGNGDGERDAARSKLNDRYRVYLYIHAQKCVGLLLAERIRSARVVLAPETPFTPSSKGPSTFSSLPQQPASSTLPTPPPSSPPPSPDEQHASTPLMASTTPVPARMGISRIWVLPTFRGRGVAARMLERAMGAFAKGGSAGQDNERREGGKDVEVEGGDAKERRIGYEKEEVAFSQPTEMGRKMAEKWWGSAAGWLVYD